MSEPTTIPATTKVGRRTLLRWGAATGAALAGGAHITTTAATPIAPFPELEEATIADLQAAMAAGRLTARDLVTRYIARIEAIDRSGPTLRSILELNPDALAIAATLDAERAAKGPRGPLHGIPILLKDNIDTADRMLTTAGSLALVGTRPTSDATVAARLRAAGAILLGKTNMSEWANFRSTHSSSGWSARGRQGKNPYALDRNPCGSSSGSAQAVAANLAAAALGTETDGSIVCPAHMCGIVGIKPTVGLTSRAGIIPIAHSQDSVGPMARTVADAAILLGVLTGPDPRDSATDASAGQAQADYTKYLDPNGLRGARIGVARAAYFGYNEETDLVIEAAIATLRGSGATIVDPADIPTADEIVTAPDEFEVLLYEFKADLNAYLATREPNPAHPTAPVARTLADVIAFNAGDAQDEMPYFGQEILLLAEEKGPLTEATYIAALAASQRRGRAAGLDAVLDEHKLDALIAPVTGPAFLTDLINGDLLAPGSTSAAAIAGYPLVTVPAGDVHGLPVGINFMGRAYSEPTLIRLAYAFEQATRARRIPRFPPTLELS